MQPRKIGRQSVGSKLYYLYEIDIFFLLFVRVHMESHDHTQLIVVAADPALSGFTAVVAVTVRFTTRTAGHFCTYTLATSFNIQRTAVE